MEPSNPLETLREILTEIGWEPQENKDDASFFVDFGEPHLPVADALAAITRSQRFVFYVNFGATAPAARRDEVARFITRANWGLTIGNFEMDYDDGQMRFKSSVDFGDVELSETLIRNAILAAMNAVEAYADALLEVALRGQSAEQATRAISARRPS